MKKNTPKKPHNKSKFTNKGRTRKPQTTNKTQTNAPISNDEARQSALATLYAVIVDKKSLNPLLEKTKSAIRPLDQALYQQLVYGALREHHALSRLRDGLLNTPLSDKQITMGLILNLGIYQLLRLELGDHGIINETVNLCNNNGLQNAKGLCNAILRRIQRERALSQQLLDKYRIYNLPTWLASAYRQELNKLSAKQNLQAPYTLRVRTARQNYLKHHPNIATENPLHPQAITLKAPLAIQDIPEFLDGALSVQDASAQWAATLLAPQNGERILDACAAPGGKTGHILELAPNCELLALDKYPERLEKINDNLKRLKLHAKTQSADALDLDSWWDKIPFDRILLDAPCSGSGVLRRHPDIAFLRSQEDLKNYPKTQMQLLKTLWQTLKTNGILLYTTCSILPRENQQLIQQFLHLEPSARLKPLEIPFSQDTGFGTLHLPDDYGDGFFYALLQKTNP